MKSNAVTFLYKFSHRKWHHSERDSKLVGVSIHVPTRGTTESIELDVYFKAFQSTFPQGERLRSKYKHTTGLCVSIHVPARGTTLRLCRPIKRSEFQSTFPQGERQLDETLTSRETMFQSTFPQGERLLPVL